MSCVVKTTSSHPLLEECAQDSVAKAKKDYEPVMLEIDFPLNVSVIQVEIELKYTLASLEQQEPVSFVVEVEKSDDNVKLSKRSVCVVEIYPDNTQE